MVLPETQDSTSEYVQVLRNDPCAYCNATGGCVDHVDLYTNHWTNFTSACRRCNTAKCQHTLLRYLLAKRLRTERDEVNAQLEALGPRHYLRGTPSDTQSQGQ